MICVIGFDMLCVKAHKSINNSDGEKREIARDRIDARTIIRSIQLSILINWNVTSSIILFRLMAFDDVIVCSMRHTYHIAGD